MSRRLTADVGFAGRLVFDRAAGTHDVAAVVSVSSDLTSIMSAAARTWGCAGSGGTWSAHGPLSIGTGPIDVPLVVDIDGSFAVEAGFGAAFRTGTTATAPCRMGFTAGGTDGTGSRSAVACDTLDGRAGAEPGNGGRATDSTDLVIDARRGVPHTGVRTRGTLPIVTTVADLRDAPWWTIDLAVDGDAMGEVLLAPWPASNEWPSTRLADRRLAQAAGGSIPPPPPTTDPPAVPTTWLPVGAVGA